MSFGLNKCANHNRIVRTEAVNLPDGKRTNTQQSYKYLGILQANESINMSIIVNYNQIPPEHKS